MFGKLDKLRVEIQYFNVQCLHNPHDIISIPLILS